MADPAMMAGGVGVDWRTVAVAACSIATTVVGFMISNMRSEMQSQAAKVAKIDKEYINREELHKEMEAVMDHVEDRHRENREFLKEISNKIDLNEAKEAKTRHDIRDAVNALVIQQSVFQEKIELWRRDNERTVAAAAAAASAAAVSAANAASRHLK